MSPEQLAHKIAAALTADDETGIDSASVVDKTTVGIELEDGQQFFLNIEEI